jgi:hypothetical protein
MDGLSSQRSYSSSPGESWDSTFEICHSLHLTLLPCTCLVVDCRCWFTTFEPSLITSVPESGLLKPFTEQIPSFHRSSQKSFFLLIDILILRWIYIRVCIITCRVSLSAYLTMFISVWTLLSLGNAHTVVNWWSDNTSIQHPLPKLCTCNYLPRVCLHALCEYFEWSMITIGLHIIHRMRDISWGPGDN